jgi:hypothetical protein
MTEAEWLSCADPQPMLEFLRGKASDRKLRLFACACCRRIWDLLEGGAAAAVEVAERLAEGLAGRDECLAAARSFHFSASAANSAVFMTALSHLEVFGGGAPILLTHSAAKAAEACDMWSDGSPAYALERQAQAGLLHEIFGNLFGPCAVDPRWLTPNVTDLAHTIYEERAFDRLPILADALMDAGCADEAILSHCRSEGPHVRGCWVVDLILGKN